MAGEWDDNFGEDPFGDGISSDVFGTSVDEVDVWGAHDSFDGDKEWVDFNDNSDGDSKPKKEERGSISSKGSSSSSRRKPSSHSKSRKHSSSRRESSSRESSKPHRNPSKPRSPSRGGHSKSRSKSTGNAVDGFGDFAPVDAADDDGFGDVSSPAGANDGFGDFSVHSSKSKGSDGEKRSSKSSSKSHSSRSKGRDEGVGSSSHSSRPPRGGSKSSKPSRQRRSSLGSSAYTDDVIASEFRTTQPSTPSRRGRRSALVRRKDGTVSRERPGEANERNEMSRSRRGAVRDSLFAKLGDENGPGANMSLSSFLGKEVRSPFENNDAGSVRSAPAVTSAGKSRRYNRRMGKETPVKKKETVQLDIAQLAEAGHIEIQDGKMRLVIDVET